MLKANMVEGQPPNVVLLKDIVKRYACVHALVRANFALKRSEVHVLAGQNGAGKSTLSRVLAGVTPADSGYIFIDGARVAIKNPRDAQRLGIGIIFQELDLFPSLSVGENIVIGNARYRERRIANGRVIETFCRPYLEEVGLTCSTSKAVALLSLTQRQLLSIARALSMNSRVLIMDEPTSSLPQDAVERLFGLIAALKQRGVAIVYVSHRMEDIFRIGDRVTVMRDGRTIGTCETQNTTADELIRMMAGHTPARAARSSRAVRGEVVLSVRDVTTRKLRSVAFELHTGEVLGIAGLVGAGRSALGAALFGLDRILSGEVTLRGRSFRPASPAQAMAQGLGLLPEDRKLQGLMMQMSVEENGTLSVLPKISRFGIIASQRESQLFDSYCRPLRIKCASTRVPVGTLSGGNQQKTLFARVLLANPELIFLDDPARGIDVSAKEDIYQLIDYLARSGKAVILASSELPELMRCADRILVLNQGRVAGVFEALNVTPELILAAATTSVGLHRPAVAAAHS